MQLASTVQGGHTVQWIKFAWAAMEAIAFCFFVFPMRRINKNIRMLKRLSSTEYVNAIAIIRSSQNLNELESNCYKAFSKCPEVFADHLSKTYNEMKDTLSYQEIAQRLAEKQVNDTYAPPTLVEG